MSTKDSIQVDDKSVPVLQIIIAILAGLGILYMGYQIAQYKNRNFPAIEKAPNFEIVDFVTGNTFSLSSFEGKGIVLNFWAPWCLPCKEEMPLLEAASQAYAAQGVVFVGVNTGDDLENARAFIDIHDITFVNGYDTSHQIDEDYNLIGIPTTWFINADGEVAYKFLGPLDEYTLNQAISRITIP